MKLGRNDICHCGSGKKYKKCCMDKDAVAQKLSKQIESTPDSANKVPYDSDGKPILPSPWKYHQLDDGSAYWSVTNADSDDLDSDDLDSDDLDFDDADYEDTRLEELMEEFEVTAEEHPEQLMALFQQVINEEKQLDEELSLEVISLIDGTLGISSALKALELLLQVRPDLYEADKSTYLLLGTEYRLLQGETATLQPLLDEIAKLADDDIDCVMLTLDKLLYLGHLQLATGFLSQVIEQLPPEQPPVTLFLRIAQGLALQSQAAQPPLDEAETLALRNRVAEVGPFEQEWLDERIDILTSSKPRSWNRADFVIPEFKGSAQSILQQIVAHPATSLLDLLLFVFVLHVRQQRTMLLSRTYLGYLDLLEYYVYQASNPPKFSSKAQKKQYFANAAAHPFALNPETFDSYLAKQLNPLFSRNLVSAATIELLPHWFQFLEAQGLLSSEEHRALLVNLGPTVAKALGILEQSSFEPHMPLAAIGKAWHLTT